jgi:hypothetical protein
MSCGVMLHSSTNGGGARGLGSDLGAPSNTYERFTECSWSPFKNGVIFGLHATGPDPFIGSPPASAVRPCRSRFAHLIQRPASLRVPGTGHACEKRLCPLAPNLASHPRFATITPHISHRGGALQRLSELPSRADVESSDIVVRACKAVGGCHGEARDAEGGRHRRGPRRHVHRI